MRFDSPEPAGLHLLHADCRLDCCEQLTLGDGHDLMRRMHAPGKEKRGVVIVPRAEWGSWLACRDPEVPRSFLRLLPSELLDTEPAPLAPKR